MRSLFLLLFSIPLIGVAGPVRDHRLVAELVPETDAIVAGEILTVCLNIKHDPHWHTYWKNPGLAGVPTKLDWDLPEGFEAGPIQWARPQRVKMAIYNTFGYEDEVTLLIDIKTPKDLQPGSEVEFKTKTTWMMCADPSSAKLSLRMPVASKANPHPKGTALANETRKTMPVENKIWDAQAIMGETTATLRLTRRGGVKAEDADVKELYLFSDNNLIDSHPEQIVTNEGDGTYTMVLPLAEFRPKDAQAVTGVLVYKRKADGQSEALLIKAKLSPQKKQ